MAGILIRLTYAWYGPQLGDQVWSDMKMYAGISDKIYNGIWEEAHFFQSIGYPLLIAGLRQIMTPAGMLLSVLQAICSSVTLILIYRLTNQSLGRKVAIGTLIISVLHLPWILYNSYALPESIFTCLLSVCAWFSYQIVTGSRNKISAGILFGVFFIMAFWLKGTIALWAPVFLLGLLIKNKRAAIVPVLVIGTVIAMGLATHGFLSWSKIGKIQLSASTGGLNFVEGKCPSKSNSDSAGYTWQSPLYYQLGLNQAKKWDRPFTESGYYLKQGLKCIQKDPFVLVQSLESIPYLFMGNVMWPFNVKPIARYTRLYELFFAVFVIVGLMVYLTHQIKTERNGTEIIVWILPILSLFLTVYIFKSEIRYRVPFDIWFIPVAFTGWLKLTGHR